MWLLKDSVLAWLSPQNELSETNRASDLGMAKDTSALRMRLAVRDLRAALASADQATLDERFRETFLVLDKNVQKGILPKKVASRCKSRLSARVKTAAAAPDSAAPVEVSFISRLRALGYTRACPTCGACSTGEGCNPK
jgi:ribosomal protein S20